MKKLICVLVLFNISISFFGQSVKLANKEDTVLPVTNTYNEAFSSIVYRYSSSIFNILSDKGKYYLFGNFTDLAKNTGPNLIIDSGANEIKTSEKWKINGIVYTAIADGNGGFYIGGSFTKIGDIERKNLAQIDSTGKPTSWKPIIDSTVQCLQKRNDTLFISGYFNSFNNKPRNCFAIYALTADSLTNAGYNFSLFTTLGINTFLIQKDTIIFGGNDGARGKVNFRNNVRVPWVINFSLYGDIRSLQFNKDSSVVLCDWHGNDETITGIGNYDGVMKYTITAEISTVFNEPTSIYNLKTSGDKAYVVGDFNYAVINNHGIARKSFFSFNASTGQLLNDNLLIDGYISFIDSYNGKLYLSGKFKTINGIKRKNFAVIDTGSLNVNSWQISPTDAILSMGFSKGKAFFYGYFNGINAIERKGFAAVDSVSGTILPWTVENSVFSEGKRMMIKGDTLFVLGIKARGSTCMVNDYSPLFRLYSISTGLQIAPPDYIANSRIDDFIIEGNYLYLSIEKQLRRFNITTLTNDASWGTNFYGYTPTQIILGNDKIYTIGDTRFHYICNGFGPKQGRLNVYEKYTGRLINTYAYEGDNNQYDEIVFDHAVIYNNKIYVQGYFDILNGKARRNFVCLDINSGSITNWEATFPNLDIKYSGFFRTSDLKIYKGQIWFGSSSRQFMSDGNLFPGFGAIDTLTGSLITPAILNNSQLYTHELNVYIKSGLSDFIMNNNELTVVGGFDLINGSPHCSIARYSIESSVLPLTFNDFTAEQHDESCLLSWETVNEINTNYFNIQRSVNGRDFTNIGSVSAKNNMGILTKYNHTDNNCLGIAAANSATKIYYRLMEIDKDGKVFYSKIVPLLIDKPVATLKLFPNPATDFINITGLSSNNLPQINIYNSEGFIICSIKNFNNRLDISKLPKGAYILKSGIYSQKFFKF